MSDPIFQQVIVFHQYPGDRSIGPLYSSSYWVTNNPLFTLSFIIILIIIIIIMGICDGPYLSNIFITVLGAYNSTSNTCTPINQWNDPYMHTNTHTHTHTLKHTMFQFRQIFSPSRNYITYYYSSTKLVFPIPCSRFYYWHTWWTGHQMKNTANLFSPLCLITTWNMT